MNSALLVGVTGGIGAGKTTVCKIFETLDHRVYYADTRAKWLMQHKKTLIDQITHIVGEHAYIEGKLNRSYISEQVFRNEKRLHQINGVVHPAVEQDLNEWRKKNRDEKFLFYESALLFETGHYKNLDVTILVTAPEEMRIQRVLSRDPERTRESIKKIAQQQMEEKEKIQLANYVITNKDSSSLLASTMEIYSKLSSHSI